MFQLNSRSFLFLIGFMGSGKTVFAKEVSRLTGVPYIDTDEAIVQATGSSVYDLFLQRGENTFRKLENRVLRSTIARRNTPIVSTGGGMPCHSDNMALMLETGLVVYLRAPIASLADRLRSEGNSRPLLVNRGTMSLEDRIRELLDAREEYYAKAHITIDTDRHTIEEIVALLASSLHR